MYLNKCDSRNARKPVFQFEAISQYQQVSRQSNEESCNKNHIFDSCEMIFLFTLSLSSSNVN